MHQYKWAMLEEGTGNLSLWSNREVDTMKTCCLENKTKLTRNEYSVQEIEYYQCHRISPCPLTTFFLGGVVNFKICVCLCVCVGICASECSYRKTPEGGIRQPREEVTGGCRLPNVGARNCTLVPTINHWAVSSPSTCSLPHLHPSNGRYLQFYL